MLIGVSVVAAGLVGLSFAQPMNYQEFESVPEPDMDRMPLGGVVSGPVGPDEPIEERPDMVARS